MSYIREETRKSHSCSHLKDNVKPSISPETQKLLDDLKETTYDTTKLRQLVADQKAGREVPRWEPPKNRQEIFEEWIPMAPAPIVYICKILKIILDIGGFAFMIVGGITMLVSAWKLFQIFDTVGWSALLSCDTIYIVGYFIIMFVIDRGRFWIYRIVNGV